MRAAVYHCYGTPNVLHEEQIEDPTTGAGQVLVRVLAASVNGYDVLVRSGALKMVTSSKFPKQTGLDFVGTIVDIAAAAHAFPFSIGDEVWGVMPLHQLTSMAELIAIAPEHLAHRPTKLSVIDAAALPVVGSTALAALRDIARLQRGERLLIRGASGGVGSIALQIAASKGAHVTALASRAKLEFVRELGADEALDYAQVGPAALGHYDVILDTVGTELSHWRKRLATNGRMVALVPDPKHPVRSLAYFAFSRIYGSRRVRYFKAKPDTTLLRDLARMADGGLIRPIIGGTYSLAQVAEAHHAFEARQQSGKQIVVL